MADEGGQPGNGVEVVRANLLLLDFEAEALLKELDKFDYTKGVNNTFAKQGGVVGVGEPVFGVKQTGGDKVSDRRLDLSVRWVAHYRLKR